jgi:hypothetical protein
MLNRYTLVLLVSVSCFINVVVKGSSVSSTRVKNQLDDEYFSDVCILLNNLFDTEARFDIRARTVDKWQRNTRIFNFILDAYEIESDFCLTEYGNDNEEPEETTVMVLAAKKYYYSCVLLLFDKGAAPDECMDDEHKTLLTLLAPHSEHSVYYYDDSFDYDQFYSSIPCAHEKAHYLILLERVLSDQYYAFKPGPYLEKFIPFAEKHKRMAILFKIKNDVPSAARQVDEAIARCTALI